MAFVIDASMALSWFLPDQASIASIEILERAKLEQCVVPTFFHIEVANQLGLKLRKGSLSTDDITFATPLIAELELLTDSSAWTSIGESVRFMNRYALTAYDSEYLRVAIKRVLPLATFDKELLSASLEAGVAVLPG